MTTPPVICCVGKGSTCEVPVWSPLVGSIANRRLMKGRQLSSFEVGNLAALMITAPAPTPCSRTGFHITTSSL